MALIAMSETQGPLRPGATMMGDGANLPIVSGWVCAVIEPCRSC
jgi:hypothetical protein